MTTSLRMAIRCRWAGPPLRPTSRRDTRWAAPPGPPRSPTAGKTYDVVIVCGGLQDTARLVYNTGYPTIAEDFQKTFDIWAALPCDVFLGAHSWFYDLTGKYAKLKANPRGVNPYIDNAGYKKYIADSRALWTKIVDEQKGCRPPATEGRAARRPRRRLTIPGAPFSRY